MKLKHYIFIFSLIAWNVSLVGQTPQYIWELNTPGINGITNGVGCAIDKQGNSVVAGHYRGTTLVFGSTTLTNAGTSTCDIFLAKYDAAGNIMWAVGAGNGGDDKVYGCTTDNNGNIFVSGQFQSSSIAFGTTTLTNATAPSGDYAIFIVKFDPNGQVLWARCSSQGAGYLFGTSCAADLNGNIIAAGSFTSATIAFGSQTLTNSGIGDMFIVKYDASGNLVWAKSYGGAGSDNAHGCSTDGNGDIIATGFFHTSAIQFDTVTLQKIGNADVFVVKFDPNGNVKWARNAGGDSYNEALACAADANGNIYATGLYGGTYFSIGTSTLTNGIHPYNMFLAKFDANGTFQWARQPHQESWSYADNCRIDPVGNVMVTGAFYTPTVGFSTSTVTNAGHTNGYMIKYDGNGNEIWSTGLGGSRFDFCNSAVFDAKGDIIGVGSFCSPSITIGPKTFFNFGQDTSMFMFKLSVPLNTGVDDVIATSPVNATIYPNPVLHAAIIQATYPFVDARLNVYDMTGKQVQEILHINGKDLRFNRDGLPPGLYFVVISDNSGRNDKVKLQITD